MKKYQLYKTSNVDWIGDIPQKWGTKKMKYLVQICNGSEFKDFTLEDGGYPVYGSGGEFSRSSKFIYDKISVLLGRKGSIDKPKIVKEPFWCSDTTYYTKIFDNVDPDFFFYLVQQINFERYVYGSTIPSMTKSVYDEMIFPYPPLIEQHQIVQFLNLKTELIDKLISTKQRKITLLKEQRTTLINQVVTKGLNLNVKMKDSGVEWIGEIPEHWKYFNLRYVLELLTDFESNGSFSSVKENVKVDDEGEVWYVRMTDLENNNLRNEKCKYCDLNTYNFLQKTKVYGGELLITKRGEIGKVYLFPYNCGLSTIGPNSYLLRLNLNVNSHFLYFFYISDIGQITLKLLDNSTTIGSLYKDDIKGSSVIVPPIEEQQKIVEYLDSKTKEIDDLVQLEQKKIDLLKEYRQSLISEVVTGKIKVTTDE